SGGSGSRLWPMSRKLLPKQFLPLVTERTMLQDTALRLAGLADCGAPLLVVNSEHRFLAAEQLAQAGVAPRAVLLEPAGRNTAPAIAAAALWLRSEQPDALLLALPSDHMILDVPAFHDAVAAARRAAEHGALVTFGIRPGSPATGYGYIEAGEPIAGCPGARRIRRFVEKPDAAAARGFIEQGGFYWNSGMFLFRAARYLEELARQRPQMLAAVERALAGKTSDLDFVRLEAAAFAACPAESVDYAVMEHTADGAMVEGDFGWSDVGSWSSLWEIGAKDADGNVLAGDVALADAHDCYVRADARHVSLLGVQGLLIVETDDAILVAARDRAQEVKGIVERLEKAERREHVSHSRVYRPWGYYESIDAAERFQVKRLMVKPGHAISLQLHHRRAEHWIVVSGTALVTRGNDQLMLEENQSTYIPQGVKHRLENPGTRPLLIVEVQSGSYLGEDDIVRFDDRYNRS
ncbi:MAG TPA: mannose-1-phosphate guanylyltransferase/mannose-6-phosphate isomerase, partial [Burkholderiales bacterium]|nr:mannose-1-phosphate guanylyltransferase/mannose-6-phosphate isomerase [Burkholderiales bacterium]